MRILTPRPEGKPARPELKNFNLGNQKGAVIIIVFFKIEETNHPSVSCHDEILGWVVWI